MNDSVSENFDFRLRLSRSPEIIDHATVALTQQSIISLKEIVFNDTDPGVIKNPIYTNQNPCQPIIDFPRDKTEDRRKFNSQYYTEYNWLEYSIEKNLVFCFTCRHFNYDSKSNKNEAFVNGTGDWKNISKNLSRHNASKHHKNTYQHWINRVSNQASVAEKLSSAYANEVKLNRKNLSTIINALYFLAKQGLALRGHDETDKTKNNGNFLELLNLLALHNSDLKKHLETSNFKYICHRSQDDIISLISQQIKSHIVNSIGEFYSIIVDETMDLTKLEQVSFCVRYCDDNLEIFERFLGFFSTPTTNAEALYDLIKHLINSFKLQNKLLVGQGYDGAATMSGNKTGVAKRICSDFPTALFVHCHSHRLNLALMDASSNFKVIRDTFNTVENLYAFIERSAKRHAQFQHIQDASKQVTLKKVCQTRWSSHFQALKAVVKTFTEIKTFLMVTSISQVNY